MKTIALESHLIDENEFNNYEYAQYAIIAEGVISDAIRRMKNVSDYQAEMGFKELDVSDTWESVANDLFIPAGMDKKGRTIIVFDASKFFPEQYKTQQQRKVLQAVFAYLFQFAITNLEDFRAGCILILDLKEAKNKNIPPSDLRRFFKRVLKLALDGYPVNIQRVILANVKNQRTVSNAVNTMGKLFIPRTIRKLIEFQKLPGLLKFIDADQIPEQLGGTYSETLTAWKTRKERAYLETCAQMDKYNEQRIAEQGE